MPKLSKTLSISLISGMLASVSVAGSAATPAVSKDACSVAQEYVRLIDEKQYDRVGELWADDAIFYSPMGVVIKGRAAITDFYSKFLQTITPVNRIGSLTLDPKTNMCVMELETRSTRAASGEWKTDASGEFHRTAVDLFQVNSAGKVQQMRVYLAPENRWAK